MKFYTNTSQDKHVPVSDLETKERLRDIIPYLYTKGVLTPVSTQNYETLLEGLPEGDKTYLENVLLKIGQTKFRYNISELPITPFGYFNEMNETSVHGETKMVLENMLSTISVALEQNVYLRDLAEDFMLVTRPPGHHSSTNSVEGFCYLNWTYLISQYLRNLRPNNKVCILDLDLHHGNGTEILAKNRENTMFMDFHYWDGGFYPGTGNEKQFVAPNIFNVNMPKRSKDEHYLKRFSKEIEHIKKFNPNYIVMSMGCDIVDGDDFDVMRCSHKLYKQVYDILKKNFNVSIAIVLEGGYNTDNVTNSIKMFV